MYEGKHIHYSEVDHKPLCSYSPKLCKQRRLNGYAFCIRHVLEDRTAPFRQCEYVAKYNSQRCTTPIPKTQDRKYCSSHLQVMGVLPKKERKKKHDTLDSLAINITVPSLALKAPNGLDHLTPCSPSSLACLLPLDPYVYCKGEKVRKEGSNLGVKPPGHPAPNHKQKHKDHNVAPPVSPSPRCPTLPTQQTETPTQVSTPPTCPTTPTSQLQRPSPFSRTSSGTSCTTSPTQTGGQTLTKRTNPMPEMCQEPALDKRNLPTIPSRQPSKNNLHSPPVTPSYPGPHQVPCLVQLKRLMVLQRTKQEDLIPHFGTDWSEDSGEEEDGQVERVASYQILSLQEKCSAVSAGGGGSRRERLAGLCSYLRQKHRLLRREERGFRREKGSGHAFREVLLKAASQNSSHAAQVLQEHQHTTISTTTSTAGSGEGGSDSGLCAAQLDGESCTNRSLPFTRHCFQHVLQNRCQQLFSSCTARFADGAQCSVPVFDITHQTPLCEEHAKKMDNFLRGDVSRRTYHHQQQLQQRRRLKKAKLPALSKKQKKKSRKAVVRRPQKPIPPAVPQGNLGLPSILCLPTQHGDIRSPLTPDLSADELPDDLTSDISDIPHDLELNQEDFSDVLPRFPDDLQDFLFEGKTSELLPTSEEAEELVRVLQAMGSYPESLACLSSMAELGPVEGSDCRGMEGGVVDLLSARLSAETLSNLELDPSLLPATEDAFSPSPPSPHPPLTPPSSVGHLTDGTNMQQKQPLNLFAKTGDPKENVGNLALTRDEDISHGSWGVLALPLSDPQFHNLMASDGLLMSTALSTPPTPMPSAPCQPTTLSALPESSLTIPVTSTSSSSSSSSSPLCTSQLKHPFPSLFNHCGIPADLQPHHSAPAPTMDQT